MRTPNILVLGSLNVDFTIHASKMPKPGESLVGQSFRQGLGGKGANQAVAASRLGARITMAGMVGHDIYGTQWLEALNREGIQTEHVLFSRTQSTGMAWILMEPDGQNRIIALPGANLDYSEDELLKLQAPLSQSEMLIIQLEMGLEIAAKAAETAAMRGIPVLLNPGPVSSKMPDMRLLENITVLTPNETEAEALTGITVDSLTAAEQAAWRLLESGVKQVALTLGGEGVMLADASGIRHLPAYQVKVADTVAAGDTFSGALAVRLCLGDNLDAAASFACAAAALSVSNYGAMESIPVLAEVESFIKSGSVNRKDG